MCIKKRSIIAAALVILMTASIVGGCVSGTDNELVLQGWVFTGAPVTEAEIAVYDLANDAAGKKIFESGKPVTGDMGSFIIEVKNLPLAFRVVARSGKLDGQALSYELAAECRDYDPEKDIIYINEVTTIISKYMTKHIDKSPEEAAAKIKSLLGIPEWLDVGSGLKGSNKYFDNVMFYAEAADNGGVAQYIDFLVAEADKDDALYHFVESAQGEPGVSEGSVEGGQTTGGLGGLGGMAAGGGLQGIGGFVARSLAQGAITYTGGKLFGWGLSQIGIGFEDETAESIKEMKQQLAQISQQLTDIKNQINEIYNKLSVEIKQTGYDIRIGQMNELISYIDSIREKILIFITNPPEDKSLLETKRKEITDLIRSNLLGKEDIIHNQLTGLNGQTPLYKVWGQIIQSRHRFLSSDDYPMIKAHFDYFDKYQEWLLFLLVEYYHATGEGEKYHTGIDSAIQGYQDNLMMQQDQYLVQPVPANYFVDTRTGNMWWRKPILETPRGSNMGYLYKQNVAIFTHGSLDSLYKDNSGMLFPPNPNSDLNTAGYNGIGTDFHDWVLPTLEQFDALLQDYAAKDGNATAWLIKNGAFPQGSTLESVWGKTGGNAWTREWYWQDGKGEVVNVMVAGVNNSSYQADILNAGKYQDAAIFPVRVVTAGENYYWKD